MEAVAFLVVLYSFIQQYPLIPNLTSVFFFLFFSELMDGSRFDNRTVGVSFF